MIVAIFKATSHSTIFGTLVLGIAAHELERGEAHLHLAPPTGGRQAARAPADWTSSSHPAFAGRLRALLGKLHRRTLQRRPAEVDREWPVREPPSSPAALSKPCPE
jgi:hypothetical protein